MDIGFLLRLLLGPAIERTKAQYAPPLGTTAALIGNTVSPACSMSPTDLITLVVCTYTHPPVTVSIVSVLVSTRRVNETTGSCR